MRTGKFIAFLTLSLFLTFSLTAAAVAAMTDEDFVQLCGKGTVQEIRTALLNGANPNAKDNNGVTALMVATIDNPEAVSYLLNVGADVNAKTVWGMTALMVSAAVNKTTECLSLLLKSGADIGAKDIYGRTALDHARMNNNIRSSDLTLFLR